jgi:hypothetical protein
VHDPEPGAGGVEFHTVEQQRLPPSFLLPPHLVQDKRAIPSDGDDDEPAQDEEQA